MMSARAEHGYTLVELLVYMALVGFVVIGPLAFIVVSVNQNNAASSRSVATSQAEAGLERLTRDLREAMPQDASGSALHVTVSQSGSTTSVGFDIPMPGSSSTPEPVTWTCPSTSATSTGSCTRTLNGGTAFQEITGVESATFTPTSSSGSTLSLPATDPAYLQAQLDLQVTSQLDRTRASAASGASHPIVVQTGVDLRGFA
jgi:type II secretory pathway pseudopilin PulG